MSTNDGFDNLRKIAATERKDFNDKIFWKFDEMGDLMGTIVGFNQHNHPKYGTQHTVEVKLADTGEIASAFMSAYICESMRRNRGEIGDKVLIQFRGRDPIKNFNRFEIHFDKNDDEIDAPFYGNLPY